MKYTFNIFFKNFNIYALAFIFTISLISCHRTDIIVDDFDIPGLGGTEEVENELDKWLYENFTKPYNIEVVYRWDAAQMYGNLDSKLVPIDYNQVKPMMAAVRDVWFKPFNNVLGSQDFIKNIAPKKIVLVGSPEYVNGAIKLGQAEGGRKILLLNANAFDAKDEIELKTTMETIIHEFAHILHQTIMYDKSYQNVSVGFYDATGWHITQPNGILYAYERGFITKYAMSAHEEDFVEMFALIMIRGLEWYNNEVIANAKRSKITDAVGALEKKLVILEDYMKTAWNIQMFDNPLTGKKGLESYMQEAMKNVQITPPTE